MGTLCAPRNTAEQLVDAPVCADRLQLVRRAREVADELIEQFLRLPLSKAMNLGTKAGFDRAVELLAARLRGATRAADAAAVREAISVLDVDWASTTAAERRRLVSEAQAAAGRAIAVIPTQIRAPLGEAAEAVVAATRTDGRRRQALAISATFNAVDRRIARHVVTSQGNFVRDATGRRLADFGAQARAVVAAGLERGLGRSDIAADLERAARASFIDRAPFYWQVVAGAFIGQARSYAQMSSYSEAGIERYRIEAVLDESTTHICRYLHGKTFGVADALRRFEAVEHLENPEEVKQLAPWVRQRLDARTGETTLFVEGHAGRRDIAAIGGDVRRDVRSLATESELNSLGIGFPPYHGLCRTTTLAVV